MKAEKLRHLAEIRISNVDKKMVDGQISVRLCNYTDVYYNERITAWLDFMNATATPEQILNFRLRPGDVLVTKDSETPHEIGVASVVTEPLGVTLCGYHLAMIRPRADVDGKFLRYALSASSTRSEFSSRANGITRFGLRANSIGDVMVPMTEMKHQHAIADYLDRETARIDALIENKERLRNLLQERWQATIHAGASGQLTQRDFETSGIPWLSQIPAGWGEAKLNLVAKLGSGHTPSRAHPEWWEEPSIPWITTGEVAALRSDRVEVITETRELISEAGLANSSATVHPAGTVVLCRTASAGYSAIMGRDMATSQDFATWTCGPRLLPRFLLLCLRAMRPDLLGRLALGSTHSTIYMPDIASIKVPLPSISDQEAVIEATYRRLPALSRSLDALQNQLRLLREKRQALITAAVTGQLDIPDAA